MNKTLEALADQINAITGNPAKPYEKAGDRYVAQIGNYHLSHNIGGYALEQIANSGGGVRTILHRDSKGKMESQMRAFIAGLETKTV